MRMPRVSRAVPSPSAKTGTEMKDARTAIASIIAKSFLVFILISS
jgi:hypothetical protein